MGYYKDYLYLIDKINKAKIKKEKKDYYMYVINFAIAIISDSYQKICVIENEENVLSVYSKDLLKSLEERSLMQKKVIFDNVKKACHNLNEVNQFFLKTDFCEFDIEDKKQVYKFILDYNSDVFKNKE